MKPTNQSQPWEQSPSDFPPPTSHFEASRSSSSRRAFTLVELLVVIAIIGLLAALLVAAVGPAITRANQARISAEINQIDTAIKDYKTAVGSFPPNAQTDGGMPLAEATIKSEFERHFLKAFPNHRESTQLIQALVGLSSLAPGSTPTGANQNNQATNLPGGMTAAEALVFWIGGFSSDPEYPISGTGGPSYSLDRVTVPPNQADPIENRGWRLVIKIENLGPRGAGNFFPPSEPASEAYNRYIVYVDPRSPAGAPVLRRINFWVLNAPGTKTPYLYFDTSRGAGATAANDTPASTETAITSMGEAGEMQEVLEELGAVHALKTPNNDASAALRFVYANNKTFQVLHPGVDDRWIAMPVINPNLPTNPALDDWLVTSGTTTKDPRYFPDGPWVEELADTLTNFTESTLEDAQP